MSCQCSCCQKYGPSPYLPNPVKDINNLLSEEDKNLIKKLSLEIRQAQEEILGLPKILEVKQPCLDWSKQHCGVHQAPFNKLLELMPDLQNLLKSFPDNPENFTWDVKVHMLMPRQYPCIPNWHVDNVPRENGIQQFDKIKPELPMYIWISGAPLTQFKHGYLLPEVWYRFTQLDEHRGTSASEFGWRGFIRATHKDIQPPKDKDWLRKHCQVYLDAETYQW